MNREMKTSASLPDADLGRTASSRINKVKHKSKTGYTWPVFDFLGQLDVALWSDDFTIVPGAQTNRIRKRKFSKLRAKNSLLKTLIEDVLAYERENDLAQQSMGELVKEVFEESQAESEVINQLVKSVSELEPRDTRFTQLLMQEVKGQFPRSFLYLFLPLAVYDFIKVRANIDALRRLRSAAEAYKDYSELVRTYLYQVLEDRQIIREAFIGAVDLNSSRQKLPLIRAKIVHAIRDFADVADEYFNTHRLDSEDIIKGLYRELYEDSQEAMFNRSQIVRLAAEHYIREQVFKRVDRVSFARRFQGVELFAENMGRFNPFTKLFIT